jgi:hypothetical protein
MADHINLVWMTNVLSFVGMSQRLYNCFRHRSFRADGLDVQAYLASQAALYTPLFSALEIVA